MQPVRAKAIEASEGTTDFGEYFFYFSFFLVVAALLLTGLFFRVGVEQRLREIGLLEAIGLPPSGVRGLFLREGAVLARDRLAARRRRRHRLRGADHARPAHVVGRRRRHDRAAAAAVAADARGRRDRPASLTAIGVLVLMLRQVGRAPVPSLLQGVARGRPPRRRHDARGVRRRRPAPRRGVVGPRRAGDAGRRRPAARRRVRRDPGSRGRSSAPAPRRWRPACSR